MSQQVALSIIGILAAACVSLFVALIKSHRNEPSRRRIAKLQGRLREACPHVMFSEDDDTGLPKITSLLCSPTGTLSWFCDNCGGEFRQGADEAMLQRWSRSFSDNPDSCFVQWKKRWDQAVKYRRKWELAGGAAV